MLGISHKLFVVGSIAAILSFGARTLRARSGFQPAYQDGHRVTVIADMKVVFTLADDALVQNVCEGKGGALKALDVLRETQIASPCGVNPARQSGKLYYGRTAEALESSSAEWKRDKAS
jgi:hypothetical protein